MKRETKKRGQIERKEIKLVLRIRTILFLEGYLFGIIRKKQQ